MPLSGSKRARTGNVQYGSLSRRFALGAPRVTGLTRYRSRKSCPSELKFKDTLVASESVAAGTPEVLTSDIVAMGQGDDGKTREGREIKVRSCEIKFHIQWATDADAAAFTAGNQRLRLMLVKDKQANSSQPTWANVVDSIADDSLAFQNLEYNKRFIILRDVIVQPSQFLAAGTAAANDAQPRDSIYHWKFKMNMPVTYTGTGSTYTAIVTNGLSLLASAEGGAPTVTANCRIRFEG
jgi:hypothetical protein